MDAERIKELERIEEMWEEMTEAIVGSKMIPAMPDQVRALARDARRWRFLAKAINASQHGPVMFAQYMGWPPVTFADGLEVSIDRHIAAEDEVAGR